MIRLKSYEKKFLIIVVFLVISLFLIRLIFDGSSHGDAFAIIAMMWVIIAIWAVIWFLMIICSAIIELWHNSKHKYNYENYRFYAFINWFRKDDR